MGLFAEDLRALLSAPGIDSACVLGFLERLEWPA